MSRSYLFSDESGDLVFKRQHATRYFAVGTLHIGEHELGKLRVRMAKMRDDLAWNHHGLDSYFHASEDSEEIRRALFPVFEDINFRVDVTLFDKRKAQPQTRTTEPMFFQYAWYFHLKHLSPKLFQKDDEVMVVAAELGTKKVRKAFRAAVESQ